MHMNSYLWTVFYSAIKDTFSILLETKLFTLKWYHKKREVYLHDEKFWVKIAPEELIWD